MGWLKPKRKREIRLFFATDVHGSDRCFRKFLNAGGTYEADVVILGGDIAGKRVIPVIRHGSTGFHSTFAGRAVELSGSDELREFEQATADAGLYAYRTEPEEVRAMEHDPDLVEQVFRKLAIARLEQWLAAAEKHHAVKSPRVLINCGNDDPFELDGIIEASNGATFLDGRAVVLDERRVLVSSGYSNDTPWHCPRDVSEDELSDRIEAAVALADPDAQLVLNLHAPPYDSGLDECPLLDEDLKPVSTGGQVTLAPVGSTAVRAAIERYQPILSLHGHVHEGRGIANLGRTLAVNPGSEYPEGILRGAVVDLDENGVLSYLLTSG